MKKLTKSKDFQKLLASLVNLANLETVPHLRVGQVIITATKRKIILSQKHHIIEHNEGRGNRFGLIDEASLPFSFDWTRGHIHIPHPNRLQPGALIEIEHDLFWALAYPNGRDEPGHVSRLWGTWGPTSPGGHSGAEKRTPEEVRKGAVYVTRQCYGGMGEHAAYYLGVGSGDVKCADCKTRNSVTRAWAWGRLDRRDEPQIWGPHCEECWDSVSRGRCQLDGCLTEAELAEHELI